MTNLSTREGYLTVMDDLATKARSSLYDLGHPEESAALMLNAEELHVLLDGLLYLSHVIDAGKSSTTGRLGPWEDYA